MSEINDSTIIRFLSGQASNEEAQEILKWKNSSEENRKAFREIEIAFNASEILMNPENFDTSEALTNVLSKLKKNKVIFLFQNRLKQFMGYAATALIAIGLTWFVQSNYFKEQRSAQVTEALYQSVETPAGANSLVTLEDGTKIWLNAKSKLSYPTHFQNNKRVVKLVGEGYFDVAKEKSRPFEVETSDLNIQVLGTVFNLKAYPEEGLIETTLIEGKISLNKILGSEEEQELYSLKPNQQAIFIKKEGVLLEDDMQAANISLTEADKRLKEKLIINNITDANAIIAWKDGKMIFQNETFESIAVKLERRYNAKIKFQDEKVKNYRFSGVFDEISIDQALKALQFVSAFHYKIEKDNIIIKK